MGREGHTFLAHLHARYDSLAEVTLLVMDSAQLSRWVLASTGQAGVENDLCMRALRSALLPSLSRWSDEHELLQRAHGMDSAPDVSVHTASSHGCLALVPRQAAETSGRHCRS